MSLCDQRDVQVFRTLDCDIPTTHGLHIVTDVRTAVLVHTFIHTSISKFSRKSPKNVKVLTCHVSHTMIICRPLPLAILLQKLTIV